jgi:hypothetical protein
MAAVAEVVLLQKQVQQTQVAAQARGAMALVCLVGLE